MNNQSRRTFLKKSIIGGAGAIALPSLLPFKLWAAEAKPNARLTMGFIGMGTQSRGLLQSFMGQNTQVLAVCDVDATRREDAKKKVDSHRGKEDEDTNLIQQVRKAEGLYLKDAKAKLYVSQNHLADFLACVKSRQKPITNERIGGRTAICCHLMTLAYLHREKIKWNPAKLAFAKGSGDPKWLTRDYRAPGKRSIPCSKIKSHVGQSRWGKQSGSYMRKGRRITPLNRSF